MRYEQKRKSSILFTRDEESESVGSEMPHTDYIHIPKSESSATQEKAESVSDKATTVTIGTTTATGDSIVNSSGSNNSRGENKRIASIKNSNINQNLLRKNSKQHIQTPRQFEEKRLQYECYIKSITLKNCQVSLNNFELIKFLGKGASGTVYLVRGHV